MVRSLKNMIFFENAYSSGIIILIEYFSFTELVILSLLTDEDKEKRQKGVALIKEAREIKLTKDPAEIRYFLKPEETQVNLESDDYSTFLLYDKVEKTEPPPTFSLSEEELEAIGEGMFSF